MVVKINRGASLYGAIIYNQQKVNDNTAHIIYGNRMIADVTGNPERVMQQAYGHSRITCWPTRTPRNPFCIYR